MSRNLEGIPEGKSKCSTCKQEKDSIHFHWYESRRPNGGLGDRKRVNGS